METTLHFAGPGPSGPRQDRKDLALTRKLAEVMAAIDRIPKSGTNAHFGYRFAQESDVLDAVRAELSKRFIFMLSDVLSREYVAPKTTLYVQFTFIDGESGEREVFHGYGEANDQQDKGVNKAFTAAVKYALMKAFLIPTGDDPDAAAPAAAPRASRADGAPQRPAAPPPPPTRAPESLPANTVPQEVVDSTRARDTKAPYTLPVEAITDAGIRVWDNAWEVATVEGRNLVTKFLREKKYAHRGDFFARGQADYKVTLDMLVEHDRSKGGGS